MKCEVFFRVRMLCILEGEYKLSSVKPAAFVETMKAAGSLEPDNNLRTVCLFVVHLTTLSIAKTVGTESNFKIIHKR